MRLSLRVQIVDSTHGAQPIAFTIDGFTCGSSAYVTRPSVGDKTWRLHRALPDGPFEAIGQFESPEQALEHLEQWVAHMGHR